MHSIVRMAQIGSSKLSSIGGDAALPPTRRSVVIVSSGIDHCVGFEFVRQIDVRACIVEPELHYTHSWDLQAIAQSVYVWGNDAEIFGDEWQIAQLSLQNLEQVFARTRHPSPVHGGRLTCWNLPIGLEAAKMVKTNVVAEHQSPANALYPPIVSAVPQRVPAVQRVS